MGAAPGGIIFTKPAVPDVAENQVAESAFTAVPEVAMPSCSDLGLFLNDKGAVVPQTPAFPMPQKRSMPATPAAPGIAEIVPMTPAMPRMPSLPPAGGDSSLSASPPANDYLPPAAATPAALVGKMPATPAMLKARQMPMTPAAIKAKAAPMTPSVISGRNANAPTTPAAIKQYGQPTTPKIEGEAEPPPKEASPTGEAETGNDQSPKVEGEAVKLEITASNYAPKRRKIGTEEEVAPVVEPTKEAPAAGVRLGMSFSEWKNVKQTS